MDHIEGVYHISFDTLSDPGKLHAVKVTIEMADVSMERRVRVDLCDHPLYPELVQYVKANPKSTL